jgi:hypothetical protein
MKNVDEPTQLRNTHHHCRWALEPGHADNKQRSLVRKQSLPKDHETASIREDLVGATHHQNSPSNPTAHSERHPMQPGYRTSEEYWMALLVMVQSLVLFRNEKSKTDAVPWDVPHDILCRILIHYRGVMSFSV